MSSRNAGLLIADMIQSGDKIISYTVGISFEEFLEDGKTKDAVVRNFEIIGEAANRLPEEFKSKYPHIHWNRIKGFRNRIVHEYFGIDYEIVWMIIIEFLPGTLENLRELQHS